MAPFQSVFKAGNKCFKCNSRRYLKDRVKHPYQFYEPYKKGAEFKELLMMRGSWEISGPRSLMFVSGFTAPLLLFVPLPRSCQGVTE